MLIFLDLDGTVADFVKHLRSQDIPVNHAWGKPRDEWLPEHHEAEAVKVSRMHTPGFWRAIPPFDYAQTIYQTIKPYKPFILTAKPRETSPHWVGHEKLGWVREHLDPSFPTYRCITCNIGEKGKWSGPGRILIDDDGRHNKLDWENGGGTFVHHREDDHEFTIIKLKEAIKNVGQYLAAQELRGAEG
jgi:hypothetical protein